MKVVRKEVRFLNSYAEKVSALERIIAKHGSGLVAFSGGVDSALVLAASVHVLGVDPERLIAVTAESASLPPGELAAAKQIATELGVTHRIVETDEMQREGYRRNGEDRCYFCKTELYTVLEGLRVELGLAAVFDGFNASDVGDHRPGARAAQERAVISPLREAGLEKDDVRRRAKELGLTIWDKPSLACLASRIPHGTRVEPALLDQVGAAEAFLKSRGFRQVRVRHHGEVARVELEPHEIARAATDEREAIEAELKRLGYRFVTLDLAGYRTGSLNPVTTK
ncbi:MAG: ATP-dependent sacrificial sulfur transferase LarE [Planctomycetota bacterium]